MKPMLLASLAAAPLAFAQTPIEHQNLSADWYDAEGDTAVLVLHGTLAHKRMEIIQTFAELLNDDYELPVLVPNLALNDPQRPGMVDCSVPHDHTHMDAVKELELWVEYLTQQGYSKVALLAHSRGGAQLAKYLQNPDEAVVAAGLVAPATYSETKAREGYKNATGSDLSGWLSQAQSMAGDAVMTVPRFVYCEDAQVTARAFLGYHQPSDQFDTPTLLREVSTPVQIYVGSEDDVVADLPDRLAQEALDLAGGIVEIEGADHFFRDLYADDVISEFTSFIGY